MSGRSDGVALREPSVSPKAGEKPLRASTCRLASLNTGPAVSLIINNIGVLWPRAAAPPELQNSNSSFSRFFFRALTF